MLLDDGASSDDADSVAAPLAEFETVFAFGPDDFDDDDDDDDDWLTDDANALFDESSDEDVFEAFGGEKRLEGSFEAFEDSDDASREPGELVDADVPERNETVFGAAASAPYGALALVPWADALNHSPNATSVSLLRFDEATNVATLRASRAYRAGEEVFDAYGVAKTPAETFLAYGFAAFPNEHRNDEEEEEEEEQGNLNLSCDACVIPGSWFWEASGRQTEAETRADASNALSLLAREEAAAGASHRSAVLGYLAAAGAAPEDVDIALRASSSSKTVGDAALRWCAAATATRAELFQAESFESANRAASRAEAARVVHALGSNEAARARARAALARLVARLLENYPSFAKEPSLASGVGRAPLVAEALRGTEPVRDRDRDLGVSVSGGERVSAREGRVATGDAAAALVLVSEARAMRAALEALVGWT
jgi:hypothetical protein